MKKKTLIRSGGEKDYTVGGRVRDAERKKDNLDEKEELAEAGQQRQKAPQDTVIHIPKLRKNTQCDDGGRESGERIEERREGDGQKV